MNRWQVARLRLWAPIWAVGHRGTYLGFRKIGLPSAFSALCVSRIMTVQQAHSLGWKVEALRYLAEYPTWHQTTLEFYSQEWTTPPPVPPVPPSPEQVKRLIRWAEGRPDERDEMTRQTDATLPYPRSSPAEISLDQILRVADSGLPYAIFTTLHEELDLAFESRRLGWEGPNVTITCLPTPRKFMGLEALYVPHFVAPIHFLACTLNWHPVNLVVGAADPPTAETLAGMPALRRDQRHRG